jgi:hypothetical protein
VKEHSSTSARHDLRQGRRPVYGELPRFQDDPHWRDLILFREYFHGDNGAGLGASHQTSSTGAVAKLSDRGTLGRGEVADKWPEWTRSATWSCPPNGDLDGSA